MSLFVPIYQPYLNEIYPSMTTPQVRITGIIRGSAVDGPGLRTVVFFKGCPLCCGWCHNPETQHAEPEVFFDAHCCIRCGQCMEVCPQGAISLSNRYIINQSRCIGCFTCCNACPSKALRPVGAEKSVEELFSEIVRDSTYFRISGGGVTLSGGEPLLYPDFVAELLQLCGYHSIHTCIDTSGVVPVTAVKTVLPHTDLFLVDVKHSSSVAMGVETVMNTIDFLTTAGARIRIRIPVVPDWNATTNEITALARLLQPFSGKIESVDLLPFHGMAESKYMRLHRSWVYENKKPVDDNRLDEFRKIFTIHSFTVS